MDGREREEREELEAEIRRRGFAFVNTEAIPQGPFYTVGWKMAAIVEKAEGRDEVVRAICDPRLLLAAYDRVARGNMGPGEAALPTWSPALLEALGIL